MHTFQLSQLSYLWRLFRSLFEKCVQENSVYKEPCVFKENEKRIEIKFRALVWTCYT